MTDNTLPAAVLTQLRQTPEILSKMLEAATPEQMDWKPAEDRWSISEVLGHLHHVEEEIYIRRIRQFLEDDDLPVLQSYDQNVCYAEGLYAGSARELLKRFADRRWQSLALLYQLPPGAEERPARHTRFGRLTLDAMLHEWAYHDLGHIRQIAELYRARAFYPAMGPYRDYYNPQP
jgi:hypothetical protein